LEIITFSTTTPPFESIVVPLTGAAAGVGAGAGAGGGGLGAWWPTPLDPAEWAEWAARASLVEGGEGSRGMAGGTGGFFLLAGGTSGGGRHMGTGSPSSARYTRYMA